MDDPINKLDYPEYIIDRALELLIRQSPKYKRMQFVLGEINKGRDLDQPFNGTDLSLSKTLLRTQEGLYIPRTGNERSSPKKRAAIAEALLQCLEVFEIKFQDGYFHSQKSPGEKWGRLHPTAPDKPPVSDFQRINFTDLCQVIRSAKKKVQILHTFITEITQLKSAIEDVLERNPDCKVEVLLMAPNSQALMLRERGLSSKGTRAENVQSKCKENFRLLSELQQRFPGNFTFATYDEIPGVVLYRVDNVLHIGFLWNQRFTNEGAYYVADFDPNNLFHQDIEKHFDTMQQENQGNGVFDQSFMTYFVRRGQLLEMKLEFNTQNFKARLTKTPHGLDFNGYMVEQDNGFCAFNLITSYSTAPDLLGEKRCAHIHTNISRKTWKEPDRVYCGQYSVLTNDALLKSNALLLVREDEVAQLTPEKKQLVSQFLFNSPIVVHGTSSEIDIPTDIVSWDKLEFRVSGHGK